MSVAALVIVIYQIVFQSMFFAKNILLRRRLRMPMYTGPGPGSQRGNPGFVRMGQGLRHGRDN